MAVIEAIPNVSEGRRAGVIDRLVQAVTSGFAAANDVRLLDRSSDPSHHRTVLTLAGSASAIATAMLRLVAAAIEAIDLREHQGVHPRIGAVDVMPFVPLGTTSMAQCVELARLVGERVGSDLAVPVFLYAEAAPSPARRRLEAIRRGGFERLASRMADPDWRPDFGPLSPHPTAGAIVIGARWPLIAWNLNLDTDQLEIAKAIAATIRERGGGLPRLMAMGVRLAHRGLAQVSMNLTDYQRTPMDVVYETVAREAALRGVGIVDSEIVGLVPRAALADAAERMPLLWTWHAERVLEDRLAGLACE